MVCARLQSVCLFLISRANARRTHAFCAAEFCAFPGPNSVNFQTNHFGDRKCWASCSEQRGRVGRWVVNSHSILQRLRSSARCVLRQVANKRVHRHDSPGSFHSSRQLVYSPQTACSACVSCVTWCVVSTWVSVCEENREFQQTQQNINGNVPPPVE